MSVQALVAAAREGKEKEIRELVRKGVDVDGVAQYSDECRGTALHAAIFGAVSSGQQGAPAGGVTRIKETATALVALGADPLKKDSDTRSSELRSEKATTLTGHFSPCPWKKRPTVVGEGGGVEAPPWRFQWLGTGEMRTILAVLLVAIGDIYSLGIRASDRLCVESLVPAGALLASVWGGPSAVVLPYNLWHLCGFIAMTHHLVLSVFLGLMAATVLGRTFPFVYHRVRLNGSGHTAMLIVSGTLSCLGSLSAYLASGKWVKEVCRLFQVRICESRVLRWLHVAAFLGDTRGVRVLLEAGWKPDSRERVVAPWGGLHLFAGAHNSLVFLTPLQLAAAKGHIGTVTELQRGGADVNSPILVHVGKTEPRPLGTSLSLSIAFRHSELTRRLVRDLGADPHMEMGKGLVTDWWADKGQGGQRGAEADGETAECVPAEEKGKVEEGKRRERGNVPTPSRSDSLTASTSAESGGGRSRTSSVPSDCPSSPACTKREKEKEKESGEEQESHSEGSKEVKTEKEKKKAEQELRDKIFEDSDLSVKIADGLDETLFVRPLTSFSVGMILRKRFASSVGGTSTPSGQGQSGQAVAASGSAKAACSSPSPGFAFRPNPSISLARALQLQKQAANLKASRPTRGRNGRTSHGDN